MNLLDRLLGHDAWTTQQLLFICADLSDEELDQEYDIGHKSLRATLHHIISNMEIWSGLMAQEEVVHEQDTTIAGMLDRLDVANSRIRHVATQVADANAWDEHWLDHLDDPPKQKKFGTAIAHVITHNMHHRAQLLYMLRLSGVSDLPEGDVFSWENQLEDAP